MSNWSIHLRCLCSIYCWISGLHNLLVSIVKLSFILFLWLIISKSICKKHFGWPSCPRWRSLDDVLAWVKLWAKVMNFGPKLWDHLTCGGIEYRAASLVRIVDGRTTAHNAPISLARTPSQRAGFRLKLWAGGSKCSSPPPRQTSLVSWC